jgi:2-oxoglutarate ferredoxin oxidoreductase subunit gamma
VSSLKQIRLCGFGGQGIVLAGVIMGQAGINDGRWVAGSSSYGAQARGGYTSSDVVISDKPITFPHVLSADILIAMSQEAYDQYIEDIAPQAAILFEQQLVTPRIIQGITQQGIPATMRAMEVMGQKQVATIVMLGAAVTATGIVSRKSMLSAIQSTVGDRFLEVNIKSVELGFSLGEVAV